MKRIRQFRFENYGIFLDLEDTPASTAVDPATGNFQLNEGVGADRYHGAFIPGAAIRALRLDSKSTNDSEVILEFGERDQHSLGYTTDKAAAQWWIAQVLEVLSRLEIAVGSSAH